jgi:hypothetical protein
MNLCKNFGAKSVERLRAIKFEEGGLEWLVILLAILCVAGHVDCDQREGYMRVYENVFQRRICIHIPADFFFSFPLLAGACWDAAGARLGVADACSSFDPKGGLIS